MVDYNIEFAHIYADEKFSEMQSWSIEILKEEIDKLKKDWKTYVVTILVDDYHSINSYVNIEKLLEKIWSYWIDVDHIWFEWKLIDQADELIQEIPQDKIKVEIISSPMKEVFRLDHEWIKISLKEDHSESFIIRHTCALLSATWQLSRFWVFKLENYQYKQINNTPFEAKNTLTILPQKYKPVEDNVQKIIASTKYRNFIPNMHYRFF